MTQLLRRLALDSHRMPRSCRGCPSTTTWVWCWAVCAPILCGRRAELTSPVAFLEKPARWMRALAENPHAFSAAPNFAFDLAARKTTDNDLAGLDLGGVVGIISGAERVEPATLERFVRSVRALQLPGPHAASRRTAWRRRRSSWRRGTWSESSPAAALRCPTELGAGRVRAVRSRARRGAGQVPAAAVTLWCGSSTVDTHRRMRGRT